jgi:hypothetical protein
MMASLIPLFRRIPLQMLLGAILGWESPERDAEPRFAETRQDLLWTDEFDAPPPRARGQRYGRYVTHDATLIRFAPSGGVDGSGALQLDWMRADTAGASCADDSRLIEASFPPTRALVVSYWLRYTPGFVFDWSGRQRCHGNAKKLFLLWAQEGSRFVFISENGWLGMGSDHDHPLFAQNRNATVTPQALADGQWHRITLRLRMASSATRADGSVEGWIDGVQRWQHDGIVTHNSGGYVLFKMPATFNAGSPERQTEWIDRLRIWRDRD